MQGEYDIVAPKQRPFTAAFKYKIDIFWKMTIKILI
jgi:hypothetical protein